MLSIPHVNCLKTPIKQYWYPVAILASFWTSTGGWQEFMKSLRICLKPVICLDQSLWGNATILIKSVSSMAMSGLDKSLQTIYALNAIWHILNGKYYKRDIRAHTLIFEALGTLLSPNTIRYFWSTWRWQGVWSSDSKPCVGVTYRSAYSTAYDNIKLEQAIEKSFFQD